MTVTGLNSDLYFSDNPIFITFTGINHKTKYIEYFTLNSDVNPSRLYVRRQNSIKVDISTLVKLYFPDIPHNTDYNTLDPFVVANNWASVTFTIREVWNDGTIVYANSITKTFVSGGRRTYESNINTSVNTPLIPTETIPQWGGYPIDYYYFNTDKQMVKRNSVVGETRAPREIRKIKGCDPLYVKFKNSLGGYSYWLFENYEREDKNTNLGSFEGYDRLKDLGNDYESTLSATSKVPKRFMPLMFDLSASREIYIYLAGSLKNDSRLKWERVTSDNNKVTQNLFNENEKVKMKFDRHHRYNPSLIW